MQRKHDGADLTAAERAAWAALPDDVETPVGLEDATVDLLQSQGILRTSRPRPIPRTLLAAAAAAVFTLGVMTGTQLANREPQSSGDPAMRLQRAGSDYVAALATIVGSSDSDPRVPVVMEVALTTYHGATRELVRLIGPEMLTSQRLAAVGELERRADSSSGRPTIWF